MPLGLFSTLISGRQSHRLLQVQPPIVFHAVAVFRQGHTEEAIADNDDAARRAERRQEGGVGGVAQRASEARNGGGSGARRGSCSRSRRRRSRGGRDDRRGGRRRLREGGDQHADRLGRAPLPPLPPPPQAPDLPVRGGALGVQQLPRRRPGQAVPRVRRRRRRLRALPRAGHVPPRRQDPVPQRPVRLPELRRLLRSRRPPARLPARALFLLGAPLRLPRLVADAPRSPRRRPLLAREQGPLRRGPHHPRAGVGAPPPGRRGRGRALVRPVRGRARRGEGRLGGVRQSERRGRAALPLQALGARPGRRRGLRPHGLGGGEQRRGARRGRRPRGGHVLDGAAVFAPPARRRNVQGDAPQAQHQH